MEKIAPLLLLLLLPGLFFAQDDELETSRRGRALDRLAGVFGTKEDRRLMLKWNALALLPENEYTLQESAGSNILHSLHSYWQTPFSFGVEWKIRDAFSLQTTLSARGRTKNRFEGGDSRFLALEHSMEPRWYFELKRRRVAGKQGNNFTGNYVGFEFRRFQRYEFNLARPNEYGDSPKSQQITLRLGLQRQLLRRGWFDLSFGFGTRKRPELTIYGTEYPLKKRFIFDPRLAAGIFFGEPAARKTRLAEKRQAFGSDVEDFYIRKFDLFGLIIPQRNGFRGRASLAWEIKVPRTGFSCELEMRVPYDYTRVNLGAATYISEWQIGAGLGLEPRWYIGKRARVLRGKSADNLNGFFVGYNGSITWLTGQEREQRTTPLVGFQSRLFRRGFVSYKMGWGRSRLKDCQEDFWMGDLTCYDTEAKHFLSELKIGVVF